MFPLSPIFFFQDQEEAEGENGNSPDESSDSPVSQRQHNKAPQDVELSQKGPLEKVPLEKVPSEKSAVGPSEPGPTQDPEVKKTEEDTTETKVESKTANDDSD